MSGHVISFVKLLLLMVTTTTIEGKVVHAVYKLPSEGMVPNQIVSALVTQNNTVHLLYTTPSNESFQPPFTCHQEEVNC